jgi:hypothetical protein
VLREISNIGYGPLREGAGLAAELALPELEAEATELELEQMLSPTRLFSCSAAQRASVRGIVGRPVTNAQLRAVVRAATDQAAREGRATARALRARPRSSPTTRLFRRVFNVPPTFVPAWRPAGSSWRDLGELVALRLERAAGDLTSGYTRFICFGCDPDVRACTTPRAPIASDRHRLWIGDVWWGWWRDSRRARTLRERKDLRGWMAGTLLHEALHIHFVLSHTRTTVGRPSVNNMYCYDTLVARLHNRQPKPDDERRCAIGWRPPVAGAGVP